MPETSHGEKEEPQRKAKPSVCRMRRQLFKKGLLEGRVFRPDDMAAAADKPRLVCIHGFGSCKDSHADVLHDVVARTDHLAFSYDMMGHGGSFGMDLDTDSNAEDLLTVIGEIGKNYPATKQTGIKMIASSYGCHVALEAYIKYLERKQDPMFEAEPYLAVPLLPPMLIAPPHNMELAAGERRFLLRAKARLSAGYLPPSNLITFMFDRYVQRKLERHPRMLKLYGWIRANFKPLKETVELPTKAIIAGIEESFGKEGVSSIFAPLLSRMLTKSVMKTIRERYKGFMAKRMALYRKQFEEKEGKLRNREMRRDIARAMREIKDERQRVMVINRIMLLHNSLASAKVIGQMGTLRISSLKKLADAVLNEKPLRNKISRMRTLGGTVEPPIIGLNDRTCCMVDAFGNPDEAVKGEYMEIFEGNVTFLPVSHMSDSKDAAQVELMKNIIINRLLEDEIDRIESGKAQEDA